MQVVTALLLTAISAMVDTIGVPSGSSAPASPAPVPSAAPSAPRSPRRTKHKHKHKHHLKERFLVHYPTPERCAYSFRKTRITWIITNRSDEDLNSGIIGFELLDASDSDNLVPLETLISNVNVAASQISAVIPETTKVVKSYGIRSVYHDAGALRYCSSPVFEVTVPNTPLNPAVTISIVLTCHTPRATSADRICSVTEFRP